MQPTPQTPLARGQTVHVSAPVRIDLAGGWSDTPPIADKYGGRVVNAAITIDGRQPIQVWARPNGMSDKSIRVHSIDRAYVALHGLHAREDTINPTYGGALHRAAIEVAGEPLRRSLFNLGTGIDLTTYSGVPTGSGLGASSILSGAILTALAVVAGESIDREELLRRGAILEKRFTGGGWQDLAGAIDPGVKLLEAEPGELPWVVGSPLPRLLPRGQWFLYDTGERRLAKGILDDVVARYEAASEHDRGARAQRLWDNAMQMRDAMLASIDIGTSAHVQRCLMDYADLKMEMSPLAGTETSRALHRLVTGAGSMCHMGAGGGGFMLGMAGTPAAAHDFRKRLEYHYPNERAGLVDFEVDNIGLQWRVDGS